MTEVKDLATQSTAVANQDADLIAQLRENSGENNGGGGMPFIPTLEINNKENKKEVSIEGTMTEVRLDPKKEFNMTYKTDGGYETLPFIDTFSGVILKVRYMVDKKWEEKSTMPFFRSFEFDNFQNSLLNVKFFEDGAPSFVGTYKDFKEQYDEKYTLWTILYLKPMDPITDSPIIKMKVKGMSKGIIWDYLKDVKKVAGSVSAVETKFSIVTNKEKAIPFNHLVLEVGERKPDLREIITIQKDLNDALAAMDASIRKNVEVLPAVDPNFDTTNAPVKTNEEIEAEIAKIQGDLV